MPSTESGFSGPWRIMLGMAAFFIIIAGFKSAQDLIVPFLIAGFIAIISNVPLSWLRSKNVPFVIALSLVLAVIIGLVFFVASYIGQSIGELTAVLPQYEERLNAQVGGFLNFLNQRLGTQMSTESIVGVIEPSSVFNYVSSFLNSLSGLVANMTLIFLYVGFMLAEADTLPSKLQYIFRNSSTIKVENIYQMARSVNQYLGLKTFISALTGIFISIWLLLVGVEFPFLWGFLAFLFNFIPNVGSIIAAIPAILMALLQLGWQGALWTAAGYLIANVVMGNIVEPKVMGERLGLSVFVVIVSLMFWGWVFGPVGMFLSVPLTIALQILLQSSPNTRWLSVLLSNAPPKDETQESPST